MTLHRPMLLALLIALVPAMAAAQNRNKVTNMSRAWFHTSAISLAGSLVSTTMQGKPGSAIGTLAVSGAGAIAFTNQRGAGSAICPTREATITLPVSLTSEARTWR